MPTMPSMHIDTEKQGFFKGAMTTHALFASAETNLVDTVTLSYGARYTYVKTDMDDIHGYKVYNPSNTTPHDHSTRIRNLVRLANSMMTVLFSMRV